MFHLVRGSVYLLVVVGASFSYLYTGLVTMFTYIVFIFDIYIWWCMSSSPTSTCVVSFLSLYTCFFIVCNLLFMFHTKMSWWVLFQVLQKYRSSKSSIPWTLFLQSFSRVCVRIDFIVFNKWVWVEWFMTSLICSFVCCGFLTDCQRGRLFGHM